MVDLILTASGTNDTQRYICQPNLQEDLVSIVIMNAKKNSIKLNIKSWKFIHVP